MMAEACILYILVAFDSIATNNEPAKKYITRKFCDL
jgi:hypothetical protein